MMGLFNLGKKNDIPLPPKPVVSEQGLQSSGRLPADELKEEIDFTEFSDEMPMLSSDSSFAQAQPDKPISPGPKPLHGFEPGVEIRELPSIDMPEQSGTGQKGTDAKDKIIYELPDFLDDETKAVKQAKPVEQKKEPEKKTEPAPVKPITEPTRPAPVPPSAQIKPKTYPTPEKTGIYSEPAKPKVRFEEYEPIPYAEKPKPFVPLLKDPFMDINRYFELKEDFETMRKLISTTQDKLEHEAMLSKDKSDKHQAVAETMNYLQEKLMLMDTKLFENQY